MGNRPRRLRDVFNPPSKPDRPTSPRGNEELIDEVAASDLIDVEGFTSQHKQSERQLWNAVKEELKGGD